MPNVVMELVPGSGQLIGEITMMAGKQAFSKYLNQSYQTVGTGYINAKWNERNDGPERSWYTS